MTINQPTQSITNALCNYSIFFKKEKKFQQLKHGQFCVSFEIVFTYLLIFFFVVCVGIFFIIGWIS